jgi:hypothetical protein
MSQALTWVVMSPELLRVAERPPPGPGTDLGTASVSRFVRQSRMVEISMSGSSEGPGWATDRGYSTELKDGSVEYELRKD